MKPLDGARWNASHDELALYINRDYIEFEYPEADTASGNVFNYVTVGQDTLQLPNDPKTVWRVEETSSEWPDYKLEHLILEGTGELVQLTE